MPTNTKKLQMCHTLNHDFLRNSSNNIVFFFVIPRVLAKNGGHLEFSEVFAIFLQYAKPNSE